MGIDLDLNKLLEPKKILSICLLIVILTLCSIGLTRNGTQIDFMGVKISRVEAPIDTHTTRQMMEDE
jgi:hypothetical protein